MNIRYFVVSFIIVCLLVNSCKNKTENDSGTGTTEQYSGSSLYAQEGNGYADGTYCAEVEYYNPNTGTRSTYTLNVDVEDNQLTLIHWPSGGWLDDSHFSPEELDSDGTVSFSTYKGLRYEIAISGPECSFTDGGRVIRDLESDRSEVTCPKCGGEKYSYDDYCDDCQDRIEKTCKVCGEYDSFMFSTDDMCSDCEKKKEDQEEEERRAEEEAENEN